MKILLTGAAGFIGHTVARELCLAGRDVTAVDDMNDHYDPVIKRKRLEALRKEFPALRFIRLDINDRRSLAKLFRKSGFTHVINLAARAGVRNSMVDPWIYLRTNAEGLLNILDQMREHGVRKLVQASTSSVYGDRHRTFRETQDITRPLSPYAASKIASESLCHSYHFLYGLDVTVFRFFTVYGPFGRPDLSIFKFIRWIDGGQKLELFGDGSQMRDFTYVTDVAAAVLGALSLPGFQIMNVGNHRPVRLNRVVGLLEGYLGRKAEVVRLERKAVDIYKTCADIRQAWKYLRWKPRVGIEEGLRRTVEWYLANKSWAAKIVIKRSGKE